MKPGWGLPACTVGSGAHIHPSTLAGCNCAEAASLALLPQLLDGGREARAHQVELHEAQEHDGAGCQGSNSRTTCASTTNARMPT